jgi:hypothetical protein
MLPGWLRRTGLEHVWRRGTLIERAAPPPGRPGSTGTSY